MTIRTLVQGCSRALAAAGVLMVGAGDRMAFAESASLVSTRDVTIYQSSGDLSNGAGPYCFVSKSGMGVIRRTLMAFDLTSIAPGSTITSATLTLNLSMTAGGSANVSLHTVDVSWGEGTSLPKGNGGDGTAATVNDATWTFRFFETEPWTTPGGEFAAEASATLTVGAVGLYAWSSAQMAADVQSWVDDPAGNHGWILLGDEISAGASKRFDTRENTIESLRPKLSVEFTRPCVADVTQDGHVNVQDLLAVIHAWGPCADPGNCPADIAPPGIPPGDDTVNVADLLTVITNWGMCP